MKYKSLLVVIALMFTRLNSMGANEIFYQPEPLVYLVAKFLARKLVHDIKLKATEKGISYKEYLASCPLNSTVKQLILGFLPRYESISLWKALPYNVIQQNLGINFRDIIVLKNDQLLVLYDELSESSSKKISKIKIWDMKFQEWIRSDINLPEIYMFSWLISKNLKTLFLCFRHFILIYNLTANQIVSKINLRDSVINSVSLFCNDKFLCCGLFDGNVSIFDVSTGFDVSTRKNILFKAYDTAISLIESIGNVIVTYDTFKIKSWKVNFDKKSVLKFGEISDRTFDGHVENVKLGFNGETILISFGYPQPREVQFLTLPDFKLLKKWEICPGFLGLKKNADGKMFLTSVRSSNQLDYESNILLLLDSRTGEIIKEFNLKEDDLLLEDHESAIGWEGFDISEDNSFIILYNRKGLIAKISLNLDEGLDNILQLIKRDLDK